MNDFSVKKHIETPVTYESDDVSIRDKNFKLLARMGGELFLTVPECDRFGRFIAECVNQHTALEQRVAQYEETIEKLNEELRNCYDSY